MSDVLLLCGIGADGLPSAPAVGTTDVEWAWQASKKVEASGLLGKRGGIPVKLRIGATVVLALACSACANERNADGLGYGQAAMHLAAPMLVPLDAAAVPAEQQKTMASKVLSAIALEQVTGRKPDPSRFADTN